MSGDEDVINEEEGEESEEENDSEEEGAEEESDTEFDDPEGYVDKVTDEGKYTSECNLSIYTVHFVPTELLEDLLKQKPKEEEGVDRIIVVDNAPKVNW